MYGSDYMNYTEIEFLNSLCPYFRMLNKINLLLLKSMNENIKLEPYQNEDIFYELVSELMRLLPYKFDNEQIVLQNDGIVQLKGRLDFIEDDYNKILKKENYFNIFKNVWRIRNKFIHEPHNINFISSVGSNTSYSMSLYYKNELLSIGTIELTGIVYKLNVIFEKIKLIFVETVEKCGENYKEYPYYKTMLSYNFKEYNKNYIIIPRYF